ncbi:hypothetical protein MKX07_006825 [Trichoderma sp. CBMAI-0711]|uniref:Uncharacterized protein n=1 Tax=Trichoderma parareesei TaxID=858221 RepID=A0A2H3A6A4_TRIPA|nr:hypothetical protein MKX07_006825 [Trichoderma sp. CBMAI-0711]OTA06734.1 hypothetical protein A9Z42_0074970 [Trichoderma parareesei]
MIGSRGKEGVPGSSLCGFPITLLDEYEARRLLFADLASPILLAVDLGAGAHDNIGSGIGRDKVSDVPTTLSQPAEVRFGAA